MNTNYEVSAYDYNNTVTAALNARSTMADEMGRNFAKAVRAMFTVSHTNMPRRAVRLQAATANH